MTRVLSAIALLPVVLGAIWWLPPVWTLLLAEVVVLLAVLEYVDLVRRVDAGVSRVATGLAALATCGVVASAPEMLPSAIMVVVVLVGALHVARGEPKRSVTAVSASVFALLYLALPIGGLVWLRGEMGREVLLLLLLTVMTSDTVQYYGGRTLGRRQLAPTLSPGKTVEGAVCGVIGAAVLLTVVGAWWLPSVTPALRAGLGALVAASGIVGDLFESGLKRSAGVKDASSLIPGHGGVLDRIDGLVFAAPVYYSAIQVMR